MPKQPAAIFEDDLDISDFQKKPDPQVVKEAAEKQGFVSREPKAPKPKKVDRRYRTGRNIPLSTKISGPCDALLYSLHDANKDEQGNPKWTIGQIIEFGLKAFQRELDNGKRPD